MGYWVRFREDGIPDAYSGSWFDGAEWVEGANSDTLDTCYRAKSGEWAKRDPDREYAPVAKE